MYLHSFEIENIRSIPEIKWEVAIEAAAGWHVIIGDNGSGKSSLLRALALAFVGPMDAIALRQDWSTWLRKGAALGAVTAWIAPDPKYDKFSQGRPVTKRYPPLGVAISASEGGRVELSSYVDPKYNPTRYVWGPGAGWFSASYGPFRRFRGGDKDAEKLNYTHPKLARHLSVFGEDVALTECITWLKELHYKQLDKKPEGDLLDPLVSFVNQDGFLPHRTRLNKISADGVFFTDGNGCRVLIENLSDGYRSILSMTLELVRQLALAYGAKRVFDPADLSRVAAPGVVLIDEIDAHLHPTWQRRVGLWFRKHFPNMQFLVTTHSPLVCQAADQGTVYRLPRPGSKEVGAMVTGRALHRLLYGSVLDAYDTELFGEDVGRSDVAREKMTRLAELNAREMTVRLTPKEKSERDALRMLLPSAADVMREDGE